ncbi:unnamed protein product [Nyctereutes procyonoides]|uniref:(raccoon dog) hypothetical protein n=1 Tax=Nyctereutes procyonoides TaxID=34880 RepID=A0A811XPS0_NYCPR|nr:unnamed protein product [Nyctereutes procyonoides]
MRERGHRPPRLLPLNKTELVVPRLILASSRGRSVCRDPPTPGTRQNQEETKSKGHRGETRNSWDLSPQAPARCAALPQVRPAPPLPRAHLPPPPPTCTHPHLTHTHTHTHTRARPRGNVEPGELGGPCTPPATGRSRPESRRRDLVSAEASSPVRPGWAHRLLAVSLSAAAGVFTVAAILHTVPAPSGCGPRDLKPYSRLHVPCMVTWRPGPAPAVGGARVGHPGGHRAPAPGQREAGAGVRVARSRRETGPRGHGLRSPRTCTCRRPAWPRLWSSSGASATRGCRRPRAPGRTGDSGVESGEDGTRALGRIRETSSSLACGHAVRALAPGGQLASSVLRCVTASESGSREMARLR